MSSGQHGIVVNPSKDFQRDAAFFTAGVGNTPAEENNYKPEDNLDEENWRQALEISKPLDLPSPAKVAEATNPTEKPLTTPDVASNSPNHFSTTPDFPNFKPPEDNTPKLGQIATIENSINLPEVKKSASYNPDSIKTTGDKLESSSIAEIDNAINELNQTGNLTNFYEEIRSMTEVNLNNSFNRQLYQGNTKGDK